MVSQGKIKKTNSVTWAFDSEAEEDWSGRFSCRRGQVGTY